jgi:hypothetical protein
MVTERLLRQVKNAISIIFEDTFCIEDVEYRTLDHFDRSLIREAIWYLIQEGEVDLTQDRKFVRTSSFIRSK